MAADALEWGDSLNRRHSGGQTEHLGDDACGGSCVDAQRISGTIPTVGNLDGVGVFCSRPIPYW